MIYTHKEGIQAYATEGTIELVIFERDAEPEFHQLLMTIPAARQIRDKLDEAIRKSEEAPPQ